MSTVLPGERGDGKIQGWHRDRLAVVYVRQSSRQQVADHGESARLQYGLTERAAALGWAAPRVMVIDEDLGRSAANAADRPGFARLVAELTMGHVGLVLGLEMSRLARAGRDWHQLIELCSLAGAGGSTRRLGAGAGSSGTVGPGTAGGGDGASRPDPDRPWGPKPGGTAARKAGGMSEGEVAVDVAVASSNQAEVVRSERGRSAVGPANVQATALVLSRPGPTRVRAGYVESLREALSIRDWAVLEDVGRLRLMTSLHLERLHFAGLAEPSRGVVRRRVLARLVRARVLQTLARRIGGVRAGSAGLVYGLDTAGARLLATAGRRVPGPPGERYTRHVLAVTELYVALVEQARARGDVQLERFAAEPGSWWPDGRGGTMKPDAYALVTNRAHRDSWWLEVDRATESLPTVKRKLMVYLDFYNRGQLGPGHIMPWILVTVPDEQRQAQIEKLARRLSGDSESLFAVAQHHEAAKLIMQRLTAP